MVSFIVQFPFFIQSISYYTTLTGEQKQTNRSTFIPLEIELTVDGIGGIYPGNSFHSTYLPKNYQTKAIFQMFEVNHTVDSSGWSVSFNGKMRATANSVFTKFDSLGEKVKKQLDGIVKKTLESTDPLFTGPPTPPYKNTNKKAAEVFTDFVTTNMHDVVKPAVNQAYEGVKSSVYGFFQKAGGLFGRDGEPVDVTNEQYGLIHNYATSKLSTVLADICGTLVVYATAEEHIDFIKENLL